MAQLREIHIGIVVHVQIEVPELQDSIHSHTRFRFQPSRAATIPVRVRTTVLAS